MDTQKLPPLFEGATHRIADSGVPVKATQWNRDGDHPMVERYPVEKREFKGLLTVDPKRKFALRFGDWIIETEDGRIYVVDGRARILEESVPDEKAGPDAVKTVATEQPSVFAAKFASVEDA